LCMRCCPAAFVSCDSRVCNFVFVSCFGPVPLSYLLAFTAHRRLPGLWYAWLAGYLFTALYNFYALSKTDWKQVAKAAQVRSEMRTVSAATATSELTVLHDLTQVLLDPDVDREADDIPNTMPPDAVVGSLNAGSDRGFDRSRRFSSSEPRPLLQ
jgi:hypothetical protein